MKFEDVKKEISCHVAKNQQSYKKLLDRFYELTGQKDEITGEFIGLRTKIIHLGYRLEDIITDQKEIAKLFRELNGYIGKVLSDMINNSNMTWQEFINYRDMLKTSLNFKKQTI